MSCTRSKNTERAYQYSWRMFCDWRVGAGRGALPATSETVSLFVAWCLRERGLRAGRRKR